MSVIEITTFRLVDPSALDTFRAADHRVQVEVVHLQRGIVRRTTAHDVDGGWLVVTIWAAADDADRGRGAILAHPAGDEFLALIDPASVSTQRFETLPG